MTVWPRTEQRRCTGLLYAEKLASTTTLHYTVGWLWHTQSQTTRRDVTDRLGRLQEDSPGPDPGPSQFSSWAKRSARKGGGGKEGGKERVSGGCGGCDDCRSCCCCCYCAGEKSITDVAAATYQAARIVVFAIGYPTVSLILRSEVIIANTTARLNDRNQYDAFRASLFTKISYVLILCYYINIVINRQFCRCGSH